MEEEDSDSDDDIGPMKTLKAAKEDKEEPRIGTIEDKK